MALHHFMRRRLSFAAHLQNSNSALTTNRYLRLIAMAVTEMVWGTAFTAFNLYNNVSPGLRPWTTWGDVHSNFSRVDQYPTVTIPPHFLRIMMLFWWVMPASAIIFFVFFGFGEEARKEYLKVWTWFRTKILRRPAHVNSSSKISVKGGSTPRPLHLVGIKTSSTSSSDDHKPSLNTSSTFAFSPSVSNLAASSPRKLEEAESDTFTISSSYDSTNSPTGASHCISISNTLASHPITPLTSYTPYPESVYEATELDFAPTSVTSHRPFSPPSICPVSLSRTTAHPAENHDIQVTVHRQESVDHIA
ncbi:hypothetical protein C0991_004521 [Blastosporella zonata]|nr:hypothetical protein C0991_004521 [Blastosporella zonata]